MGATKTDQRVGGVAEAQQRATDFQIEIGRGGTRSVGLAGVENDREKQGSDDAISNSGEVAAVLSEKPRDFSPIAHHIPQMPKKPGNKRRMHVQALFCRRK